MVKAVEEHGVLDQQCFIVQDGGTRPDIYTNLFLNSKSDSVGLTGIQ
jgi:hypothetical protein